MEIEVFIRVFHMRKKKCSQLYDSSGHTNGN
uniref:Uncharacterized protein n=1 Tax=Rhizophora mucronata TaxID=61149 RepID=A0A2P2R202_RHIMU